MSYGHPDEGDGMDLYTYRNSDYPSPGLIDYLTAQAADLQEVKELFRQCIELANTLETMGRKDTELFIATLIYLDVLTDELNDKEKK